MKKRIVSFIMLAAICAALGSGCAAGHMAAPPHPPTPPPPPGAPSR